MSNLVIVSKLADLTGVPYYGDLKLGSATMSPLTESTSCVLTGFDETIQAHSYDPIRCYNAAVYKCISRQEFYIFCPLSEPKYLLVYKTGSIFSQSRYQNVQYGEIYLDTLNYGNISFDGASFPYFNFSLDYRNVGGDNKVTWIEDLPIFENLKDFVNYVTKPRPSVKVSYYLPDDTYTYSKLTYNSEHEPEDKDDGTSIDILPTNTSVNVNGLQENMLYYFTIFTNKSESEPFPFTITPDPVPPEYKTYIDNINSSGFNWIKEIQQDTATITNSDHSTFTSNMYKYYPMNKVTWYTYHHQGTDVESWNKTTFGGLTTALFVSSKIDKVEINSNNGVYSCTITKNNQNTERDPNRMFVYDKTITMGGVYTDATLPRSWYANFYGHSDYLACTNCNPFYLAGSWSTRTFIGTLTEVFTQLQRYVRNIDIYVDGELWSKAGK